MVWPLEAKADGNIARGQVDQPPRDKERADPARTLFVQRDGGLVDAADPPDPRADQNAGALLFFGGLGFNPGIVNGLLGSGHGINDEGIDLALFLGVHPLIGIVLAVGGVAERQAMSDLAGNVTDVEFVDAFRATLAGQYIGPSGFNSAAERRNKTHPGDDDAAQFHAVCLSQLSQGLSRRPW